MYFKLIFVNKWKFIDLLSAVDFILDIFSTSNTQYFN